MADLDSFANHASGLTTTHLCLEKERLCWVLPEAARELLTLWPHNPSRLFQPASWNPTKKRERKRIVMGGGGQEGRTEGKEMGVLSSCQCHTKQRYLGYGRSFDCQSNSMEDFLGQNTGG